MENMSQKYRKILEELDNNIENKNDLDYIKQKISELFMIFFDEIDSLKEIYEDKVEAMIRKQKVFEERISKLEGSLNNIEKDIYVEDGTDFEIICPYCNNEFVMEMTELKDEIECPECRNTIELDWNEDDSCDCGDDCHSCHGKTEEKNDNEDDM